MRCLWLTLADPEPPTNGQFIYSGEMLRALASGGAQIDVVGLARTGGSHHDGYEQGVIRWWLAEDLKVPGWKAVFSVLPYMAFRMRTRPMQTMLNEVLARMTDDTWDAVIFDSLCAAWMLAPLLKHCMGLRRRPPFVYLAQNHEATLAARVATLQTQWLRRQVERLDAIKAGWLERLLIDQCELITANSAEECAVFRAEWPKKRIEVLAPTYTGPRVRHRAITAATPRRVVMTGSYDWLPKLANLEEFVSIADPYFAARGIELMIVGRMSDHDLARLRRMAPATTFTGPVPSIDPYLAEARMGVVAETVGGGFKIKALDYAFRRVPLAILSGTAPGFPMRDNDEALVRHNLESLVKGIADVIDDFDYLHRIQENAFTLSSVLYDSRRRAEQLYNWIASLDERGVRAPAPVLATAQA